MNIVGVLSQVQDGQERFLGCWGRKCNKYERNYPSYKGELLAVIQFIKKWKHRPFEVHTDASTLKNYHEEPVPFVYKMVPGTSWFQFHCDT